LLRTILLDLGLDPEHIVHLQTQQKAARRSRKPVRFLTFC
jgi:hypothetical protein